MQKSRNYGVDILRGVSLLLIFCYHYYQFKGTYIGVIIFFALSGYLVTDGLLEREFSYVEYWKKKVLKLYPLLLFIILFSTVVILILEKGLTENFRYSAISTLFAVSNIYQGASKISYFESHTEILPLVHTWALSLEIQFYIFYPLILHYFKKKQATGKDIAKVLFMLANLSFLCMLFQYYVGKDLSRIYYGTDTRLFTFLIAGALCSYLREEKLDKIKRKYLAYFAIFGCAFTIFFCFSIDYTSFWNYIGGLYIASFLISCSIAACFYLDFLGRTIPYVGNFLVRMAQHGYSYYLWQYVIMIFANEYFKWLKMPYHIVVLLELLIVILVSEASYFWIEQYNFSLKKIGISFLILLFFLIFLPQSSSDEIQIMQKHAMVGSYTTQGGKSIHRNQIEESLFGNEEQLILPIQEKENSKEEKQEEGIEGENMTPYLDNITFIGDSVMKMCEVEIKTKFPNAYVDAAVSRQFSKLPSVLKELEMQRKLSSIVVIHLGSNGPIQEGDFIKVMELLKDRQVYFINAVVPKPWETEVNHLLNEKAKEYSNITILDWYHFAKGKSKWFYKDATHPKPNGAKKYSQFILEGLS